MSTHNVERGPTSLKAVNRAVADWLPDHNSGTCEAVTDFVKFLLGRLKLGESYPAPPTLNEISRLPQLSYQSILEDRRIFALELEVEDPPPAVNLPPRHQASWFTYRKLFIHDLCMSGIPRVTVDWKRSVYSPWNEMFLAFAVKHYRWAKQHGAFGRYPINPVYDTDIVSLGILERWLRGRSAEMKSLAINPGLHLSRRKYTRHQTVSIIFVDFT